MEDQQRRHFSRLFANQIRRPEADLELDRAALYLAGDEYPALDVNAHRQMLDDLAAQVRELNGAGPEPATVIRVLNHYMFEELGFAGNSDPYYSADNTLLNRVLDTRSGMPIALAVVYLELGRRLGIQCHGVGLPGHFLVRLDDLGLFLDPFNKGQLVSATDCRRMVRDNLGPHWGWREEYLSPYSKKDILYRTLSNLKSLYLRAGNYLRAIEVLRKMSLISPASAHINRDLAWCYANLEQHPASIRHLEIYIRATWPSQEPLEMRHQVESLWSAMSKLGQQSG